MRCVPWANSDFFDLSDYAGMLFLIHRTHHYQFLVRLECAYLCVGYSLLDTLEQIFLCHLLAFQFLFLLLKQLEHEHSERTFGQVLSYQYCKTIVFCLIQRQL